MIFSYIINGSLTSDFLNSHRENSRKSRIRTRKLLNQRLLDFLGKSCTVNVNFQILFSSECSTVIMQRVYLSLHNPLDVRMLRVHAVHQFCPTCYFIQKGNSMNACYNSYSVTKALNFPEICIRSKMIYTCNNVYKFLNTAVSVSLLFSCNFISYETDAQGQTINSRRYGMNKTLSISSR